MTRGVLVFVRTARTARACLRRAVCRDLLPRTTQRLRHTIAVRQVKAVIARCTRGASVRRARLACCHVAVGTRSALLELALAIARRCLIHRLVLRVVTHRVRGTRAASVVRKRWRHLHVFRAGAHVHIRALPVGRCRWYTRLARDAQGARCPCAAMRVAMSDCRLVRTRRTRRARAASCQRVG